MSRAHILTNGNSRYSETGSHETGSSRRSSQTFRGEMVQLRLLKMEERYRSHLLYEQIKAFEDKVYLSFEHFNVDILYHMFVQLAKRTVVDIRKLRNVANLRQCFKDLKKLIRCKLRHRHVQTTQEEEKLVKYFTWFFQYLDYLRELRHNFVDRVYSPLFRYFYNIGYDRPEREYTTDSDNPSPSVLSFRSLDSGYSGISGLTSVLAEGDQGLLSARSRRGSDYEETQASRKKYVTKNALLVLGREFNDIRKLYDTSEIEKFAQRLSHLKDRMDFLLDTESRMDINVLCQDSERAVFHLKIREYGNENIMRVVPDILIKFQKAAWLCRRWLERDDEQTKDLNAKLDKLTALDNDLNKRLCSLSKEIQSQEKELETQSDMLNTLLTREERSNNLGESIFDIKNRKAILDKEMQKLTAERSELCRRMTEAYEQNDRATYKRLQPLYQRNKLQRFALERQLATLDYHVNIMGGDMDVELEVKASVILNTNDVQDKCEEIEQRLEKAKKEQKIIQTALIPIGQDRRFLKEQIQIKDGLPRGDSKPSLQAEFVSSSNNAERLVDLNADYLGTGRPMAGFFITSLPEEGHVTPIAKPIQAFNTSQKHQRQIVPDLCSSEW